MNNEEVFVEEASRSDCQVSRILVKDNEHWTDKRCLMELFWDVRQEMVDDHISTSQIVRVGLAVTDVKCSLTAKDVYFRLNRFEERLKIEKTKRKADGTGPSNPKKAGTADVDVVEQFKSIVTQTMGRKSHKEVIALVCCSDETFAPFEKFVKKWELGKIPDVHELCLAMRRSARALLSDASLSERYREVYDNWDELAAEYPFPPKWLDCMIKWVPDKAEKEMPADEASSSDLEDEDGTRRMRKTKKKSYFIEPLPSQVVTAVHRVYQAKRGEATPERLEPIHVLHVKDISKYQLTLDEKLDCQLVFLDLTHPHMVTWEKQEFSSFLSIIRDLTVAKHFIVVAVMEFGQTPVDFTNALKEMKDARFSFEYGCYEGPRVHRRSTMSYPCWQLMYVFVSLDAEEYKPDLVDDRSKRSFLIEYEPDSWLHETEEAEGDDADNIKFRIPLYFACSTIELEFITKYAKALLLHSERVKQWFTRYSSSKGHGSSRQILAGAEGEQRAHAAGAHMGVVVVDEALMGDALARLGTTLPQIQFEQESDGEDHKSAEQAPGCPPPSLAQESVPITDQETAVQANASGPPDQSVENVEIQPVADIEKPHAEGNIDGEILVPKELSLDALRLAQNHKPGDQEAGQREVV
ncbi:hypothetical protein R1sor_009106 [Riccia sorocarpa]|uniref:Uncharacterized protein n=1 Tax=Riccia sorocarpa TaxID=122646 RepID=A0ABD3H7N4_9MARC